MDKNNIKKSESVKSMFSDIAYKYDLLNNLMTFGLHKLWKKESVLLSLEEIKNPKNILDMCCGTGDLGIILSKHLPDSKVLCLDFCNNMVAITNNKIKKNNFKNIECKNFNIENLSLLNGSYDLVTIGFGLRNLVEKENCIKNVYSILNDGGVFLIIDLGHPPNILWKKIYSFFFFNLVPILGKIFAKNKDAYTYLPTSLNTWYKQEELKELILKNNFKKCFYKNFFGGIVSCHIAVK